MRQPVGTQSSDLQTELKIFKISRFLHEELIFIVCVPVLQALGEFNIDVTLMIVVKTNLSGVRWG